MMGTWSREFPAADLLAEAAARLRRQTQFAKPLERGGRKGEEMRRLLDLAAECVMELSAPIAVFRAVSVAREGAGFRLDGKAYLSGSVLPGGPPEGGWLSAYVLTLRYAQEAAFEKLGRDYMLHHFQTMLGREMLFALGRAAQRWAEGRSPGFRLRRIALRMEDDRQLWDAAAAQGLLQLFGAENPGVAVTEAGFFTPLNSTLGLIVAEPAAGATSGGAQPLPVPRD